MKVQKKYYIHLNERIVGYTLFEGADAPMGVVFGKIYFENGMSGYEFVISNQNSDDVEIYDNNPEDSFINASFKKMIVISDTGTEIKGIGINISGFQDDFEISIVGIPYPFYEEEFPHHKKIYDEMFK
jgi:hypothetical protein